MTLKLIGYWKNSDDEREAHYPDPYDFVDPAWLVKDKQKLIEYLQPDQLIGGQWDYSWCRFHCGIEDKDMGSLFFTDGIWLWPQGLVHYITAHNVVLPDEFISNCILNKWKIPDSLPDVNLGSKSLEFWMNWASGQPIKQNQSLLDNA